MNYYTTEAKRTASTAPANMNGKTAEQIVAYGMDHYRHEMMTDGIRPMRPANKFTAFMSEVSDTYFDPSYWKNPIYAKFPMDAEGRDITEWVKAAIIWYHGAKPSQSFIGVFSQGYAC